MMKSVLKKIFEKLSFLKLKNTTRTWRLIAIIVTIVSVIATVFLLVFIVRDVSDVVLNSQKSNILMQSVENVSGLKNNINALKTDTNLLRLVSKPDKTAIDVILEALPTNEDSTELAALVQKNIFQGIEVKVSHIAVAEKQQSASNNTWVKTTSINFSIIGKFEPIRQAIQRLERSIRPIDIESIVINKSDDNFTADITAITFYVPETIFVIDDPILPDIKKPSDSIFGEKAINLKKPILVEGQ